MNSALEAQLIAAGVTMEVETVPQQVGSLKDARFQFIITIRRNHDIWRGPYSMGYGHYPDIDDCYVPGSRTRFSVDGEAEILRAINNNRRLIGNDRTRPILSPSLGDVMEVLLEDAAPVLDGLTFIHWCQEYDMNPDSIKDKATYEKCLDIGLCLVRGFGATELLRLRELTQE
jgi:hypothetical protein